MRTVHLGQTLDFPTGYDPRLYENEYRYGRRYYWSSTDNQLPPARVAESLLECKLQQACYGDLRDLPPRSYLAVTQTSPDVPLGYRDAREVASFHVVQGRW